MGFGLVIISTGDPGLYVIKLGVAWPPCGRLGAAKTGTRPYATPSTQ